MAGMTITQGSPDTGPPVTTLSGELEDQAALAGVRAARYPITVTIDDDLQNPPEELPSLIAYLEEQDLDVVHALARGELRTIAATTWAEYKKYIEKDPALTRRFQSVQVDEPDEAKAILMMRGVASTMEKHHQVQILDEALEAAVKLSHRYIPARQLPDKSVSLLDTACARVAVSQHAVPAGVDDLRRRIQSREMERDILPVCRELGIGYVAYAPLGRGLLTGRIRNEDEARRLARVRHPNVLTVYGVGYRLADDRADDAPDATRALTTRLRRDGLADGAVERRLPEVAEFGEVLVEYGVTAQAA